MHYSCDCSNRPKLKLDRDERVVEIDIQLTCPRCYDGDELIRTISVEIRRCPNLESERNEMAFESLINKFVAFLIVSLLDILISGRPDIKHVV